jgi:nitroreductase
MSENLDVKKFRQPEHDINPLILSRWSPRAFSGEPLADEEMLSLFEAAKWAPSSMNQQPWRFIYARRDTPAWPRLFSFLNPGNQAWAERAALLIVVISQKNFIASEANRRASATWPKFAAGNANWNASFDAGAAWENLALEASHRGLITHAIAGFDYDRARSELSIPDDYQIEVMIAAGRQGDKFVLPERYQEREFPSDRKPLNELISEGEFRF